LCAIFSKTHLVTLPEFFVKLFIYSSPFHWATAAPPNLRLSATPSGQDSFRTDGERPASWPSPSPPSLLPRRAVQES
jgi:hypothetical protein